MRKFIALLAVLVMWSDHDRELLNSILMLVSCPQDRSIEVVFDINMVFGSSIFKDMQCS